MPMSSSAVSSSLQPQQPVTQEPASLMDKLQGMLSGGKNLLSKIWGGSSTEKMAEDAVAAAVESAQKSVGMAETAASVLTDTEGRMPHGPRIEAASSMVQAPQSMVANNPYFTTTSDAGKVKENVFQKIRIRFRDLNALLTKQFGSRFSGYFSKRNHLSSGRQQPREDLRKKSRYREEDQEIDCVLTDDSYLMDSYDRKGEYSRLTTENKR